MPTQNILMLGDSFGTERVHRGVVEVPAERTWPRQVSAQLPGQSIQYDFLPFRRLVECPDLIAEDVACDLLVLQAGMVDAFPRPFPLRFSKSMSLPCRLIRRLVRPWRREWINYVHATRWSSAEQLEQAFESIAAKLPAASVGLITLAPLTEQDARKTPGAQEAIMQFNDQLREQARARKHWFIIDLHPAVIAAGYTQFVSPVDSHLNQRGNDWLAHEVLAAIEALDTDRGLTATPPRKGKAA